MMEFIKKNSPATEKEIIDFELLYNVSLPVDYKEFISKSNGGILEKSVFKLKQIGSLVLNSLYSLEEISSDIHLNFNDLPDSFIPIGDTPDGDEICISLKDNNSHGAIYYWVHDADREDDYGEYNNNSLIGVYLIENSFSLFLNSLKED